MYGCVWLLNPSPPVLIYSRQSQNVQSFDPSRSTLFYMRMKEKSISVTGKKKNVKKIFTMVESELFIQKNHSQWPRSGTK